MHELGNVPKILIHHPGDGCSVVVYGVTEMIVGAITGVAVATMLGAGVLATFFVGVGVGVGEGLGLGVISEDIVASCCIECSDQKYHVPPRTITIATTHRVVVFIMVLV